MLGCHLSVGQGLRVRGGCRRVREGRCVEMSSSVSSLPSPPSIPALLVTPPPLRCVQGCASAPVWDGVEGTVVGVVSASDFIHTLQRLRCAVSRSGNNPLSEAEMDAHTVGFWGVGV